MKVFQPFRLDTVNYLKIDCEGGEYAALRGMDVAYWARVERVVVEYHDFGGDRHGELVKILEDNGFEVAVIRAWQMRLVGLLGAQTGMISKDSSIKNLFMKKLISKETAIEHMRNPESLLR